MAKSIWSLQSRFSPCCSVRCVTALASIGCLLRLNRNAYLRTQTRKGSTLSIKDTTVTVVWIIADHLYTIQGQINTDEAIKLAESVKFIE